MPAIDSHKKLRKKLTSFINSETYYNYAQMAIQLKNNTDQYSLKVHGVTAQDAYNIADSVFGKKVGYTDNIESFLENTKNIPGYNITIEQKKQTVK